MVIAAVRFRAKLAGQPGPVGPIADRAHKGFRRAGRNERGRGQAPALDLDAIREIAGQCTPRDRAIVLTMFQACLRRSEAAALEWRDVEPAATPGALRITVRASKTNQEGAPDVRLVKNGAAKALLANGRVRRRPRARSRCRDLRDVQVQGKNEPVGGRWERMEEARAE